MAILLQIDTFIHCKSKVNMSAYASEWVTCKALLSLLYMPSPLWLNWPFLCMECFLCKNLWVIFGSSQDRSINHMERDLRWSLVQLSAQDYETKQGCSELFLVWSWKPLKVMTAKPSWATCCSAWLSSWQKTFFEPLFWFSTYTHCLPSSTFVKSLAPSPS